MELFDVMRAHLGRYPLMRPRDAVKLIYQNEFGGGHLIKDPEQSLLRIRREYAATRRDPETPLLEDIGGGMARLNFAPLEADERALQHLNEAFVRSSAMREGSVAGLLQKLDALAALLGALPFAFSADEFLAYRNEYERAGCPMVSHSETYRNAYAPAYRVVLRALIEADPRSFQLNSPQNR